MELTKSNIFFNGKSYPVVEIELTEEESNNHCGESLCKNFADDELWNDICQDGEPDWNDVDDPRVDTDGQIDYYMDDQSIYRWHKGEISDGEMKVKVARIILSWQP